MPSLKLKVSILVALMMVAVGVYFATLQLTKPEKEILVRDAKTTQTTVSTSVRQDSKVNLKSVDVLLVGLKDRLEKNKDDVDGWVLLSKSYYHLNRLKQANRAFEKAKALGYTGSWKPLPRIDSFSQNNFSSQKNNPSINFRDYLIYGNVGQAKKTGQ